jgi:hypothetical protein
MGRKYCKYVGEIKHLLNINFQKRDNFGDQEVNGNKILAGFS